MQFGNIMYVAELDATVTISPGMLAYVKDKGPPKPQNPV